MISVIEQPGRLDEILNAIGPLMQDGLIVISDVEMRRFVHALPSQEAATDASTATS